MDILELPGFDTLSTQLARELYDPASRLDTDLDQEDAHAKFAAFIRNLYGATPDSPSELLTALICDAVESGLDEEEVLIARAERAEQAGSIISTESLIIPSVQSLVERARQQAGGILQQIGIEEFPPEKRTLYACTRIAQAAYEGKERMTGEPYYEHPKRAAAMALHIFNTLEQEGYVVESGFKDAVICTALLHDATEETIRSCKYYNPDRPKGFSPLLVREVFRQTDNPHGRIVANSLRLMTHYAKQDWAPSYETYVKLGSADFIFDLVKVLDMGDNLLHPKPITDEMDDKAIEKIQNKRALYKKLIGTLAINAAQHTDNRFNRIWSPRFFGIFRGTRPEHISGMIRDLNLYIFGSEEEPSYAPVSRIHSGQSNAELVFPDAA